MVDNAEKHFVQLESFFDDSKKGIHPKTRELIILWSEELRNDNLCYNFILEHKLDITSAKLSEIGDYLSKCVSELLDSNLAILNNTESIKQEVALLSSRIVENAVSIGFKADIKCGNDISVCPIPIAVAERNDFINKCKDILDTDYAIHIYGSYRSGKSVASCLLAKKYPDYIKVIIRLNDIPYSLTPILDWADNKSKKIFVLDGANIEDCDKCDDFCRSIKRVCNCDCRFIINSYTAFKDVIFSGISPIKEIQIQELTEEDVKSMFAKESQAWGRFTYGVTAGSPELVQLAYNYLNINNYKIGEKEFGDLFMFAGDLDISSKCRKVLGRMITDQNALLLLNRLLLFSSKFTEKDVENIANIHPVIDMPLQKLSLLTDKWVTVQNGIYEVIPLVRKTLKPDINKYTKKDCCIYLAGEILKRHTLDVSDVVAVMTHYLKGELYDKAAQIYMYSLHKLNEQGLLEKEGASILTGIWIDLPLPEEMSLEAKIALRMSQLVIIGFKKPEKGRYIANDLRRLVDQIDSANQDAISCCYHTLTVFYSISGDANSAISARMNIKPTPALVEVLPNFDEKSMFLLQMSTVKDEDNLAVLMDTYESMTEKPWDLFYAGCNCAISNVTNVLGKCDTDLLERIIEKSYRNIDRLYPFAISAVGALISYYATNRQFDDAVTVYSKNLKLLDYTFGKLQVNFAYAACLVDMEDHLKASKYYNEVYCVNDLSINAFASLTAAIETSNYSREENPEYAVKILMDFLKRPGFDTFLTKEQQMLFYGSLSIAYWLNNQKLEALKIATIVSDYIWNNRTEKSESYKNIAVRLSALLMQMHSIVYRGEQSKECVPIVYNLFTKDIPGIVDLYSDVKIFGDIYLTAMLKDMIAHDEDSAYMYAQKAVELSKVSLGSMEHSVTILSFFFPLLLKHNDWDAIEHIVLMTANYFKVMTDAPKNLEFTQLYSWLLFVACHRCVEITSGNKFDDERVISLAERYLAHFDDESHKKEIMNILAPDFTEFERLSDDLLKTVSYLWHFQNYSAPPLLSLMYRVYSVWNLYKEQSSMLSGLNNFLIALYQHSIKCHRSELSFSTIGVDVLIKRALSAPNFNSSARLLKGYYFILKNPPQLNKEMEDLILG